MASKVAPYGSWKSPITSDLIVSETIGLGQIVLDGVDIYWLESRPAEGGRNVIVRRTPDGQTTEITPLPYNVRTKVHEMGGGAYTVNAGTIYFVNFQDQRLYRVDPGAEPRPLTAGSGVRYADGVIDSRRGKMIAVREDHTQGRGEPVNTLVSLDLEDGESQMTLASGNDFYASPRISPDGTHLAWLTWNHPNMPWDGTELWLAELGEEGGVSHARCIAGREDESIFQPEWSLEGILHFVSDRTGWWNLYRLRMGRVEPMVQKQAEFGLPQWVFGLSTYAFESGRRIICSFIEQGESRLASIDTTTLALEVIDTPYTEIQFVRADSGQAIFIGASPTEFASVVQLDLVTGEHTVLCRSSKLDVDSGYISIPEAIEFPIGQDGTAHAFYYPPKNRDYSAPPDERPLLRVLSHGGPTGSTSNSLSLGIQYWTSRGIAILDVNYGGSTGYGREYRRRLEGRWGIVDVDDCSNGADYLVNRGDVDPERLIIKGGSAGGYTTLCALTFRDVFNAGASYYGICDLEALTEDTHKFESHYTDRLVGPYPQCRDTYRERSPIHFVDRLSCPVIFFQGLEDRIVPPNQAEKMVQALREKGLPVAYVPFQGEQHGLRRAENIKRALDAELYFYSRIFGFELAESVESVPIENL